MKPADLLNEQPRPPVHAPAAPQGVPAGYNFGANRSTPEQLVEAPTHAKFSVGDTVSWENDPLPQKTGVITEAKSYVDDQHDLILYKVREQNNTQYWFRESEIEKVTP